jgi:(E)-4-hydroxy-3-methylbut-2-enyl-diphosphate synthase
MNISRKLTKKIKVGNIFIGGDAPITVQTMVKADAHDVKKVVAQIKEAQKYGCDIVRMGVLDMESVKNFGQIKKQINIPIVADIHLNYKFALEAIRQGVDKLRINPGNIGDISHVREVVKLAKEYKVPIRIGINGGSLEKDIPLTPQGLVQSASRHIQILEDLNYDQIIVSLKTSDIQTTVEAYQLFSEQYDYPVHLGITEAGTNYAGTIKSSIGIGALLLQGIGDTIRVSLTSSPVDEIKAGIEILKQLNLKKDSPTLVSCPTCSRTQYDMFTLANKVEKFLLTIKKPIKVAVMGCIVNGPGEAKEADCGIAGGKNCGVLFKKGEIVKTVAEKDMFKELVDLINSL